MVASVTPLSAPVRSRALAWLREASVANGAPPSFTAQLDTLEQAVLDAPTQKRAQRLLVRAWLRLERLRPRTRVRPSAWRRALQLAAIRGADEIGDEPPEEIRVEFQPLWMPEDVNRFRRDIDAAFASLDRKMNRFRNQRGFRETDQTAVARSQFLERWGNWKRESARLRDSWWDRAWRDGANTVIDGAKNYAAARRALVSAGYFVEGSLPAEALPAASEGGLIPNLFDGWGGGIALVAVAAVVLLSMSKGRN